ncbi:MAG TPA: hypothetical protein V6D33_17980 [Cyanophyceae cyanobacterium]
MPIKFTITSFCSLLLGSIVVASSILPVLAQQSLLNQAFKKTQVENFEGAIQDLVEATQFFIRQKDWENVYKSRSLIKVLQNRLEEKNTLESGEKVQQIPDWYKLGTCIGGNDICDYTLIWATPDTAGTDFEGILVLQKHLRYLPNPEGGETPVQSVIDAQVVPKLKGGEWLGSDCSLKGDKGVPILAIYQTRGFEDAEFYSQISRAWRVNIATQKIEPISSSNVVCVNHCPGGC